MEKVLIIIPAYNEEENIVSTCTKITEYNKNNEKKFDFIVVNDCSKDNTLKLCKEHNFQVIDLVHNLGIGGAVQTGYKYAYEHGYDVAVQFDGDGQHDINYVKDIVMQVTSGKYDMAIGSRFIDDKSSEFKSSTARRAGIKLISFFIKLFTGKKIYDTTSGFRAINKDLIKYFSSNYPAEYPEPVSEVMLLMNGFTITEVPVSMNERVGGVSSIRKWKNVYYMINVILSIFVVRLRGKKNVR